MTDTRPMTEDEKRAALLLAQCTFQVASYNKRFAGDMASIARTESPQITERQGRTLWKLFYMYRKQLWTKRDIVGNKRLFDTAKLVYDEERAQEKEPKPESPRLVCNRGRVKRNGPSQEDLQALERWNQSTKEGL